MFREIQNRLRQLFNQHKYLKQHLDEDDLQQFQSIVNRDQDYTQTSLKFLSQLLTKYHGSPCIVLIDEYDAPLECAYNCDNDNPKHKGYEFLKEAKTFFGALFSGLLKVRRFNH
jgi:glycosidase